MNSIRSGEYGIHFPARKMELIDQVNKMTLDQKREIYNDYMKLVSKWIHTWVNTNPPTFEEFINPVGFNGIYFYFIMWRWI